MLGDTCYSTLFSALSSGAGGYTYSSIALFRSSEFESAGSKGQATGKKIDTE
jgi:hypothetical protein